MLFSKKTYQEEIIQKTRKFRPTDKYIKYPPYHIGPYIEEYFFDYFIKNKIETNRIYIPIFWTNINNNAYYVGDKRLKFGEFLKELNQDERYFTICQHEDFSDVDNLTPDEKTLSNLPEDIVVFSGSGKLSDVVKSEKIIPIPHVVSPIPNPKIDKDRDVFCSFVGANTHPVRDEINRLYRDDKNFFIHIENWNVQINKEKENLFKDITERSVFTLCPRGNGPTSYRIWESMQLGSIPVYIYDNKWIPWEFEINWNDICIFIHCDEVSMLKTYLMNIPQERISQMRENIDYIYSRYFTLDKVCETVIKKIKENE